MTKHMFGLQTLVLLSVGIRVVQRILKIFNIILSYIGIRYGWICYGGIVWVHISKIQVAEGILVIRVVTAVWTCGHAIRYGYVH